MKLYLASNVTYILAENYGKAEEIYIKTYSHIPSKLIFLGSNSTGELLIQKKEN